MKYVIIPILVLFTGCGAIDRSMANLTGDASEVCHDGVIYLQFTSGSSVKYTPSGHVATCEVLK